MNNRFTLAGSMFLFLAVSCSPVKKTAKESNPSPAKKSASLPPASNPSAKKTFTKPLNIDRVEFVAFAKTLLGTPYKYGSSVPESGLDCSGFVSYVFGHFNVKSPRTTVAFTNEGKDIDLEDAKPGDLILFTGSDNSTGIVGHMGIITVSAVNNTPVQFIHSASGKNVGVILNSLSGYYKTHFVKVIRILE